jgi:hypothetical protein
MKRKTNRRESGVALVAAICFTVVVLGLGLGVTMMTTQEQLATRGSGDTIALRNLAEAGIERALDKMNQNPLWSCAGSPTDFTNKPLTVAISGTNTSLGTYTVDPIVDLGGDYVQVTGHGYWPAANSIGGREKRVRVIAYKCFGTPFSAAAYGRLGVPLANGDTNSYDSARGGYSAQTPGSQGDIRTDSTDPGSITIFNNGQVNGRVMYGPGTNLANVTLDRTRIVDGDANESNDIMVAPKNAIPPDVTIPATAQAIGGINAGSNTISGSLAIPAGTWYCDGISLSGQKSVTTTGAVILYVRGNMSIGGNGILNNGDTAGGAALASNLIIYGTSACTSVSISGNGALTGAVYAPSADIVLNGGGSSGEVFGALAGKTVSFNGNGTVLHYDLGLQRIKGVVTGFRPKSWQED